MLRLLTVLACLLAGLASAAAENEPRKRPLALGSPARPEAVASALRAARDESLSEVVDLAERLGAAGGRAAASGLKRLIEDRDTGVRTAALKACARVGLRVDGLNTVIRTVLNNKRSGPEERRAAMAAIAAVGTAQDFEALLALASPEAEDPEHLAAPYRAMARLSGAKLPFVYARWTYWWRTMAERGPRLTRAALKALEADPDGDQTRRHEAALAAHGWTELALVEKTLANWLQGTRGGLRAPACRLSQKLGLADLAPLIAQVGGRGADEAVSEAARRALEHLGYVAPRPRPAPKKKRDKNS